MDIHYNTHKISPKNYSIVQTMTGHILNAGSLKTGGGSPDLKSDVPDLKYKIQGLRSGRNRLKITTESETYRVFNFMF